MRHILEVFINKVTDKRQLVTKKQKSYLKNLQNAIHHSQFVGKAFITEINDKLKICSSTTSLEIVERVCVKITWWLITLHVLYFTARTVHTKQSYNIIIILKGFFSPLMIIVNGLENSSRQLTTQTASSFSVGIINIISFPILL